MLDKNPPRYTHKERHVHAHTHTLIVTARVPLGTLPYGEQHIPKLQ